MKTNLNLNIKSIPIGEKIDEFTTTVTINNKNITVKNIVFKGNDFWHDFCKYINKKII